MRKRTASTRTLLPLHSRPSLNLQLSCCWCQGSPSYQGPFAPDAVEAGLSTEEPKPRAGCRVGMMDGSRLLSSEIAGPRQVQDLDVERLGHPCEAVDIAHALDQVARLRASEGTSLGSVSIE